MGAAVQAAFGNSYPSDPRSGAGVRFVKNGLSYRVQLDFSNIAYSEVAPITGTIVAQNADGSFTAFDLASLPISPLLIVTLLSGPVPETYPPRRGQFFAALEASGAGRLATVRDAVPYDVGDPINQAWNNTMFVAPGSVLANFVKNTLAMSQDDMSTLFRQARLRSE